MKEKIGQNYVRIAIRLTNTERAEISKANKYPISVNGKDYCVIDGESVKCCVGEDYNYIFRKNNGHFERWGIDYSDDPSFSPVGPEILDIEVTTSCQGVPDNQGKTSPCSFCYKSNTPSGSNMPFKTFKKIIDNIGKQLTQIAFGADSECKSNPDIWKMAEYCRKSGIIPNITVANIDDKTADNLVKYMGAVAVSRYANKNICYDSIKRLTDRGMNQVNIHIMVSEETYHLVQETLNDRLTDPRLAKMNAIVLLGVKPKGRAVKGYSTLSIDKFEKIVSFCRNNKIIYGFDSCSAPKFEHVIKGMDIDEKEKEQMIQCSESCESSLFSAYINTQGEYWHCSFSENEEGQNCVDAKTNNFLNAVWYSEAVKEFREKSLKTCKEGCRRCHVFPSINP